MTQTDLTDDRCTFTKVSAVKVAVREHQVGVEQMRELLRYCSRRPYRCPCLVLSSEGARFVVLK